MNTKQKINAQFFLLAMLVFAIFPPWHYQFEFSVGNVSVSENGSSGKYQFDFIFSPPQGNQILQSRLFVPQNFEFSEDQTEIDKNWDRQYKNELIKKGAINYNIDISRLITIWLALSFLGLILHIGFSRNISTNKISIPIQQ